MAGDSTLTDGLTDDDAEQIIDVDVSSEMRSSFLEYAYSVIYSRALPDARDGLKPVQRRILYSMDEMGVRPDRGHVKCARVVGEVMGKLHPHGDGAIYDALVRCGQPWAMRLPLVDPHGNFGSPDNGPAAMRYTECRMTEAARSMTDELDQDTVDFRPNYDGREVEPAVLPAAWPNLLVNGATGIAVGMATAIAPHNLVEVVGALQLLLRSPDASLAEVMRHVPGPDFPGGGRIVGLQGVKDAYATGRGTFRMRATTEITRVGRRQAIEVTELPHGVGPEKIVEQIKNAVQAKKLQGIADVKDLADLRHPTRLVIEIKNGFSPEALLEQLHRQTKLEDTFGMNCVALVEGQPRTLSLLEMLRVFLDHRREVVRRRTEHDRTRALERLHLVEGLLIAILDIDEVIAIIRAADDAAAARERLRTAFDLTETQATYILDMQLRRLTKFSRLELEAERDDLTRRIADLTDILDNPDRLTSVIGDELTAVAERFGTPRRTVLLGGEVTARSATPTMALEVADDPCWVLLGASGAMARTDTDADLAGPAERRASQDVLLSAVRASARAELGLVTSAGRVLRIRAIDLPTVPVTSTAPTLQGAVGLAELVSLEKNERPLALVELGADAPVLALATRRGVVKRVVSEEVGREEWSTIRLQDGDEVVGAAVVSNESDQLVLVTDDARLLRFDAALVRPQGRAGGGVAGIKLGPTASVIGFFVTTLDGAEVATVASGDGALPGADTQTIKLTALTEFPAKGRATGGVRCHRLRETERLTLAWVGPCPTVAATARGAAVPLPPEAAGRRDAAGAALTRTVAVLGSGASVSD